MLPSSNEDVEEENNGNVGGKTFVLKELAGASSRIVVHLCLDDPPASGEHVTTQLPIRPFMHRRDTLTSSTGIVLCTLVVA